MNLTEIKRIRGYLQKGETEKIEAYLKVEELECYHKQEVAKEKKCVEAVKNYRREWDSLFFQDDNGRFIVCSMHSVYVLNSDELIQAYNKMAMQIRRNKFRYRPFGMQYENSSMDQKRDHIKDKILPYFEKIDYKEIGSITEEKIENKAMLIISSKDKLSSCHFSKKVVDYAKYFLGDNITYSMNDKSGGILFGQSEKGKVYILGYRDDRKKEEE